MKGMLKGGVWEGNYELNFLTIHLFTRIANFFRREDSRTHLRLETCVTIFVLGDPD